VYIRVQTATRANGKRIYTGCKYPPFSHGLLCRGTQGLVLPVTSESTQTPFAWVNSAFGISGAICGGPAKVGAIVADRVDVDISAIARQGLEQAQIQLENAASRVAGAGPSSDSFISDSVDLTSAKINFAVNIKVMKTIDEIQKSVLDLLA
jgi:hypothetical protein